MFNSAVIMLSIKRICIFLILTNTAFGELNISLEYSINDEQVTNCIKKIIEQVKTYDPAVVEITAVNFNTSFELALFHKIERASFISRTFLWRQNTFPNLFYIIRCQNYEECYIGITYLTQDLYWNPRGKFILVIDNLGGNVRLLSSLLDNYNIYNISIICPSETDQDIYVFDSELDSCGKPVNKVLEFFMQCGDLNSDVNVFRYPLIKTSMRKRCKIKVLYHNYWPFMSINKTEVADVCQYQLQLWSEFAGVIIEPVNYAEDQNFGKVYDNYTITGMLRLLYDHKINVATGGYAVTYERARAFASTYPYTIDHTRAIVARSGFLRNWQAVFIQFNFYSSLIICSFFAFFVFAVVKFSIFENKTRDVARDILAVFGYLCSNTSCVKSIKTSSPLRIIVCSMLILVFFLSFLVQAYLLSATTNPLRKYQIKHLDEALSECKPWRSWSWQTSFDPTRKSALDCRAMGDCLPMMKERRNEMLFTVLSETYYYSAQWAFVDASGEPVFYQVLEPVTTLLRTAHFRRGSTTFESFNRLLMYAAMGGLEKKNLDDLMFHERLKNAKHQDQSLLPQTMGGSSEIFVILLVGYVFAIIAFMFENRSRILFWKPKIKYHN